MFNVTFFQQYFFSHIVAVSFYWWRKLEYPEKTTDLDLFEIPYYCWIANNNVWWLLFNTKEEILSFIMARTTCISIKGAHGTH
jgi:hypothetical protein